MQQETNPTITIKTLPSAVELNPKKDYANLSNTGFLKIFHIIGNPKAEPPIPALIPISRTSWLDGVKSGKYPKSYKLGARSVAWKTEDIQTLISQLGGAL